MPRTKNVVAARAQQANIEEAQAEISTLWHKRLAAYQHLVGVSANAMLTISGFSDSDDWTKQDEFRSRCATHMEAAVADAAEKFVAADAAHKQQIAFVAKLRKEATK